MPMKKITFNASLNHKAYSYEPMQIEVEKVITLYGKRFEQMRDQSLEDATEIIENRDLMYCEEKVATESSLKPRAQIILMARSWYSRSMTKHGLRHRIRRKRRSSSTFAKEEIIMIHIIILHIIIFCQICKTYFKRKFSKYNESYGKMSIGKKQKNK